jgi:hypothetical protein
MGTEQCAGCGKPQVPVLLSIHMTSIHGLSTSMKEALLSMMLTLHPCIR